MKPASKNIVTRINERLTNDLWQKLLTGALRTAGDLDNPVRHHQFSSSLRSLFENLLHDLAPDENVKTCDWFQIETDNGLASRRQRAVYATQGGLSDRYIRSVLGFDPTPLHKRVVKAISSVSKYTHVRPESLVEGQKQISAFVKESLEALEGLFLAIEECRRRVLEALQGRIDQRVVDALISDTLAEIDILATHYWYDEHTVDRISVISIDHEEIKFRVDGNLSVGLQYGSDSDYRNDFGVRLGADFPFVCVLTSPTEEPNDLEIDTRSISIDTTDWWEEETEVPS
jgi:hypothetical protein